MRRVDEGYGLVAVLFVILVLSILASSLGLLVRNQTEAVSVRQRRDQEIETADAAIMRAILGLSDRRPSERWTSGNVSRAVDVPGGTVSVDVTDEDGRIDLNTADRSVLVKLLTVCGSSSQDAASLADAIRDWTDPDDLHRANGAEANEYRAAGLGYVPRNQYFESVEEVRLVKGMTATLYAKMRPALTVYSGLASPEPGVAGPLVRKALGLDQSGKDHSSLVGAKPGVSNLGGRTFRIDVAVGDANGHGVAREAVIRFTDDLHDPYWVLQWHTIAQNSDANR